MFKKVRYGIAILGLPLSLITMAVNASYTNCQSSAKIVKGEITAPFCDVSFTGTAPAFSCLPSAFPQSGVSTYRRLS